MKKEEWSLESVDKNWINGLLFICLMHYIPFEWIPDRVREMAGQYYLWIV